MWRMQYIKRALKEEKGIGVIEVILILVVLIGLIIIFKPLLISVVQNVLKV